MLTPQQAKRLAAELFDDNDKPSHLPLPPGEGQGEGIPPLPPGEGRGEGLPQQIGSYRIRRIIAVGGMGTVYEAEQTHPHRTVALKVMKREYGLRGRRALRRFEYESEILASLRHPGIAQIYEAGTHDDGTTSGGGGVPYFVMEYIPDAKPITKYADQHKLSIRQRLELFAEVCDAVHHGHQKGIIHRDLTPGNILVGADDDDTCKAATSGRGLVKIIDFGIARATDSDIAVTTMHTDVRELIGTLQYMSPEQCAGDSRDLDIRSDVYSLGVVLYELLCGQLPYDLSHTPIPQATRVIQEIEPPRPSTISKRLKGNLEAIVLKALEKDREKRFQSTADLVRNIRNHLAGKPLDIRPPTRFSLALHWLVKHPIITTTAACLTIAGLSAASIWISVWWVGLRPYDIELTPDGREARLVSMAGATLHKWTTEAKDGIAFAELVERPPALGGGKLALIGFSSAYENPYPGELCAFDMSDDRDHPIWTARITDGDMLPEHIEHGYKSAGVGVIWCNVQDVFTDRDHPGPEVIACYQHGPGSACAVRIYDLNRELLYQIWHDGALGRGYWMTEPGRLILPGTNSEAPWSARGYDVPGFPLVVLAVEPKIGHIAEASTTTTPGGDTETLAWYKCLWPPTSAYLLEGALQATPYSGEDPARFVRFNVTVTANPTAHLSWLLDQDGTAVPGTRATTDGWKLDTATPDPELFYLADLPPIVSRKDQPD